MIQFKHSGQLGDIVYSLPAMKNLANKYGDKSFDLYIANDKVANHAPGVNHIGGNYMVSFAMYEFLEPLLATQKYISSVHYISEAEIPASAVDFDIVRNGSINLSAGNIKDYYYKAFGLLSDSPKVWLEIQQNERKYEYDIVIGRSTRYLNISIDYTLLNYLDLKICFIGTPYEFKIFSQTYPSLRISHLAANSALDTARAIQRAKLFIGNQSLFFSIAEALQVDRILEVFEPVPNVVPSGGRFGEYITNRGLCFLLEAFFPGLDVASKSSQSAPSYLLSHPIE